MLALSKPTNKLQTSHTTLDLEDKTLSLLYHYCSCQSHLIISACPLVQIHHTGGDEMGLTTLMCNTECKTVLHQDCLRRGRVPGPRTSQYRTVDFSSGSHTEAQHGWDLKGFKGLRSEALQL